MARLIAAVAAVTVLAACVPTKTTPGPTRTIHETIVSTVPASTEPAYTPPAPRTVVPLTPGIAPAKGEVEKACPYVASSPDDGPNSVANIIGSHVLRTTVLTSTTPAGCRFYFYAPPYEAIADIVPRTFSSARAAYAALVATGNAGASTSGHHDLVPGVDAILFRTAFFGPDGARDWACAFAAGRVLVVVHTQRDDLSFSALRLAEVVARKFG